MHCVLGQCQLHSESINVDTGLTHCTKDVTLSATATLYDMHSSCSIGQSCFYCSEKESGP